MLQTGHNVFIVLSVRFIIITGLLFVSALLFTTAGGWCAEHNGPNNLDRQIAERMKQYQESLRQRAEQLSPSLRDKIESQAQQTVAEGLEKWKNGDVNIHLALPNWVETRCTAQFVARHLPFPGSPAGSLAFGISLFDVALIVTTVQYVLKTLTLPVADSAIVHSSSIRSFRQNGDVLSYFVRIVCTIVQRQ
jgi:hypothetical protein